MSESIPSPSSPQVELPSPFSPTPSLPFSPIPSPPLQSSPPPTPSPHKQSRMTRFYHPYLTGEKCDSLGNPLPADAPPDTREVPENPWEPFNDIIGFHTADLLYRKVEMSQGDTDFLLNLWNLSLAKHDDVGPFHNHEAIHETIDSIKQGSAPWRCFVTIPDTGLPADAPEWKKTEYEVWYRDPETVIKNMLDNPEFAEEFDTKPYIERKVDGTRRWSDVMSGNYAWTTATKIYDDDNTTEGAMLVPIILGSDKTTVSVATGNVEYHPLYLSIGNVHNTVRRAHRNAVVPIAFLPIPKSDRQYDNDPDFRLFKKQLYHSSVSAVLQSLKSGMTKPVIRRCPDGHFRRVIYDLAAYIADYPEQVYLSGIVQGWCPKCTAPPPDLDAAAGPRSRQHTEALFQEFAGDGRVLWDNYGVDDGVTPFTHDFPRADIHMMLTSDLLHQTIKGTFKDHLVDWVLEYLVITEGKARAQTIMDDIDCRIAAMPVFPGLRQFPHGRQFKQWTGDDSKALMKVFVPAVASYLPDEMLKCFTAFLDFCYLVRRPDIDETDLKQIENALERFHHYREVFRDTGVRDDFNLPRQHALVHYREVIILFSALGGLCSSITESRHITAVKKPWRRSTQYQALSQMLLINQHLDKLATFTSELVYHKLLPPSHLPPPEIDFFDIEQDDVGPSDRNIIFGEVNLAKTRCRGFPRNLHSLGELISVPTLETMTRQFLHEQLSGDLELLPNRSHSNDLPFVESKINVFASAVAEFHAPRDVAGIRGMSRERIRCTESWKGAHRKDCALVVMHKEKVGFQRFDIHEGIIYPCALVQWYKTYGSCPDSLSVIHVDSIYRGVHLLPVFGDKPLPQKFNYRYTLDCFSTFYVNRFADHHANEILS
ncbi:hypothetical protein K435DRAFT_818222 [Dendrothele bispora CBS 962.96]|uniref:Uncharacterized protein n=1 Tax=Dendrothele bispora (strain CBS 962.96) TaxID=1314807 RepID=A0A4S8ME69_DENBC|nr:hypothetical protein K435DRAFT_818222 [Dendrothele bispora CBS 962.96]